MRIVTRHLLKEVLLTWGAVLLVLFAILLTNRLARYLAEAVDGALPAEAIFQLLALKAVAYLVVILPPSLFIALLLTLGRWYRDREMTALVAAGLPPLALYRPLLVLALVVGLGVAWIALEAAPRAAAAGHLLRQEARLRAEIGSVGGGQFKESRRGDWVFFAAHVEREPPRIDDVFIQRRRAGRVELHRAARATVREDPARGARYAILEDGYLYEGTPGAADFRIVRFERQSLRLPESRGEVSAPKAETLATAALWNTSSKAHRAELEWRLAAPLSVPLLTLLALPLSRNDPRQGRYGRLVLAGLIYIAYFNLQTAAQAWFKSGMTPAGLGTWWVHAGMALFTAVWVWRETRR